MADDDPNSVAICCLCLGSLIFLGLVIGLPVTSIYLGVTHYDDCPAQKYAPLFLIVLGSITLAYQVVNVLQSCCQKDDNSTSSCTCLGLLGWLLALGFLGWVITGIVWYAKMGQRTNNPDYDNYCEQTLYAYFSAQVIMCSVLLGLLVLGFFCSCCCSGSSTPDPEDQRIIAPAQPSRDLYPGRPERATIQTIQTSRLRAIQNGPNILYVMEQVRVNVLRVEH